jgi:hypothetical protein
MRRLTLNQRLSFVEKDPDRAGVRPAILDL